MTDFDSSDPYSRSENGKSLGEIRRSQAGAVMQPMLQAVLKACVRAEVTGDAQNTQNSTKNTQNSTNKEPVVEPYNLNPDVAPRWCLPVACQEDLGQYSRFLTLLHDLMRCLDVGDGSSTSSMGGSQTHVNAPGNVSGNGPFQGDRYVDRHVDRHMDGALQGDKKVCVPMDRGHPDWNLGQAVRLFNAGM